MAFAAGLAAAAVCTWLFVGQPRPWPYGEGVSVPLPVFIPRLQRLLIEQGEELEYRVGLNGVPAATLRTAIRASGESGRRELVLEYEIEAVPTLDRVWSFARTGKTVMNSRTLLPSTSESVSRSRDREKRVSVRFDRQSGIATVTTWKSHRNKTTREEIPFELGLDIPSAFLFARVSKMPLDEVRSLRVHNGDDVYEVAYRALRTEQIEVAAGRFDAIEVDLHVRKLEEDEPGGEGESTDTILTPTEEYRSVRVWLSQERRIPLKLDCHVLIGQIYAELVAFKPAPPPD